MNTEDFVTYEQAVKLKELGFDWKCLYFYPITSALGIKRNCSHGDFNSIQMSFDSKYGEIFSAPTLAQAQKWLRNVKKADIIVTLEDETDDPYQVEVYINKVCVSGHWRHGFFTDFDEALSVGISKALELLINKS